MDMTFCRFLVVTLASVLFAGCATSSDQYRAAAPSIELSVQRVLAKQGYYQGPHDGTIGPATSRAIRNYQLDHKLTPTGTINSALTDRMGLTVQEDVRVVPVYRPYPVYSPWYDGPGYYPRSVVIGGGYYHSWNRPHCRRW